MLSGHWFPPHVFLHLTVSPLSSAYTVRSDSFRAYTDAGPGAGSLVGREPSKSLRIRLLVSVLRRMELLVNSITF